MINLVRRNIGLHDRHRACNKQGKIVTLRLINLNKVHKLQCVKYNEHILKTERMLPDPVNVEAMTEMPRACAKAEADSCCFTRNTEQDGCQQAQNKQD